MSRPSWIFLPPPTHPTPLGCHKSPGVSSLHHSANSHWLSILHMAYQSSKWIHFFRDREYLHCYSALPCGPSANAPCSLFFSCWDVSQVLAMAAIHPSASLAGILSPIHSTSNVYWLFPLLVSLSFHHKQIQNSSRGDTVLFCCFLHGTQHKGI